MMPVAATQPQSPPPPDNPEAALEAAMVARYPALAEPRVAARLLAGCRVAMAFALDHKAALPRGELQALVIQLRAAILDAEAGAARPPWPCCSPGCWGEARRD